jgi:hypothetical protein
MQQSTTKESFLLCQQMKAAAEVRQRYQATISRGGPRICKNNYLTYIVLN